MPFTCVSASITAAVADQQPVRASIGHDPEPVARSMKAGRVEADLDRVGQQLEVAQLSGRQCRPEAQLVGHGRRERAVPDPAWVVATTYVFAVRGTGGEVAEVGELERE